MRLWEISIRRPVLVSMVSLALVLWGTICLIRLPVREFPDVNPPIITITTVYPGASAEVIENQITEPLEESFNSIEGKNRISSQSKEQVSIITLEFNLSTNINAAIQDVHDRILRDRGNLPKNIEEPIVSKQDADAQPVLWVALYSGRYSPLELSSFAENIFKPHLQTVSGVSSIILGGNKRFAIRLWLDPQRMSAKGVTVIDIENTLKNQNVELPSGHIQNLQREFSIETLGELKTVQEYNDLVIKKNGLISVHLSDVGHAVAGIEDESSIARYNSMPCVGIGIVKQSKANTIQVIQGVKKELKNISPLLPAEVNVSVPYDESIYIEQSINEVWVTLAISFVIVVLTIFIFLHNFRLTLIPAISIPICLIATFGILSLFGYSINIVTMLGFILTVGLVVDDSIIVVENIYRHVQQGMKPLGAALLGMKEIGFAVISTSIVLVVVFLPMAFQTSVSGRLFIEFAIVISFSVLISAFVALTLSPMISAYFIKPSHKDTNNSIIKFSHKIIHKITVGYEKSLSWSLERPLFVILSAVVVLILSICLYTNLEYDFLPDEDKGRFLCILIAPQGSTSEYTDRMVKKMEKIISSTPEVEGYFSAVALAREGPGDSSEGLSYVRLKEQRKRNLGDILLGDTGLGYRLYHEIEGAIVFPIVPQSIGDSFSQPFQLVLQNQDLKQLSKYANVLNDTLTETPFLENVRTAFQLDKPKLNVIIDRKRAASLGVSIEEITHTLQILFDGLDLSTVNISGKKYNIIAQLERKDRLTPSDIDRIYVQNTTGQLIQLSSVARYEMGGGPNSIDHFNRYRSATIKGSLLNVSLGTAIKNAEQLIKKDLPAGFHYEWAGEAKNLLDSKKDLFFVLALSVLIIFMVLASQFENLIDPFTVMLTVPLAAFGAFGSLWFLNLFGIPGMGINLFSQIGLVLLIGLVTKNGILLVDFANQQMAKGKNAHEAMVIAGLIRLRPILMTVAATIVGILPIVIGFGIGAAGRRPLGIVVVGGMITSTFLTLFVIPVTYVLLSHLRNKFSEKRIVDHKKTLLIIIILSVFSSGCSIGPKYKIPLVDMSNKWKSNLLLKEATPGDSLLKGDWWTIFNDSTLDNLEKQAIVYNQDLKIAFATLNQARASAGLSQAAYIPDFEINPGYTNLDTLQNKFFGRANNIEGFYSIPLDISYEIDLWGRVKKTVESAKDQAQANDAAFQSVLLTLTSDVARNYFILKELDKEVKILEEISKLTQTEMSLNKDRYKAGILKILDIKRQAQELRDIRSQIIDVTIKRIEIENALGVLCGQNPSNFKISIEPLKETLPIIPVGIPSELLERRPDIAEAERLMAAANAMIGATKASFYPKVTLLGSTGFASAKLNALLDSNKIFSSFGPDISWSILNLKANKSNLQIILAKYDQTVATYRQRILIAFNEVEDALINIHAGEEKWNLQEQTVSAEAEDAKTSKEGYHQGVVNYIEVLDAERSVLKAELKSSVIMNNRFLWTIQLIKTLGGGWVQKDKV